MNKREDQVFVVNVLFDTGSQKTFMSYWLVKELKLAPLVKLTWKLVRF